MNSSKTWINQHIEKKVMETLHPVSGANCVNVVQIDEKDKHQASQWFFANLIGGDAFNEARDQQARSQFEFELTHSEHFSCDSLMALSGVRHVGRMYVEVKSTEYYGWDEMTRQYTPCRLIRARQMVKKAIAKYEAAKAKTHAIPVDKDGEIDLVAYLGGSKVDTFYLDNEETRAYKRLLATRSMVKNLECKRFETSVLVQDDGAYVQIFAKDDQLYEQPSQMGLNSWRSYARVHQNVGVFSREEEAIHHTILEFFKAHNELLTSEQKERLAIISNKKIGLGNADIAIDVDLANSFNVNDSKQLPDGRRMVTRRHMVAINVSYDAGLFKQVYQAYEAHKEARELNKVVGKGNNNKKGVRL